MSIISQKILFERHQQLSSRIIDFPFSDSFALTLDQAFSLGKVIKISDQEILRELVKAVLYLIIPRENLKSEIIIRLQISPAYAEIINQIIQRQIFEPLKNELEKYKHLLPQKPFESPEISKASESPASKTTASNDKPEESVLAPKLLSDLPLPEIQEIKIERPLNKLSQFKKVITPSISPEERDKIHSRLVEVMRKKESRPKIVEEMKKVISEGRQKTSQTEESPPKKIPEAEKPAASQVISGEDAQFRRQQSSSKDSLKTPYIFDVKLKEREEKKEQTLPEKEIKYRQSSPEKPFGEA